jgi:hypothetical protein
MHICIQNIVYVYMYTKYCVRVYVYKILCTCICMQNIVYVYMYAKYSVCIYVYMYV